jgi:hypothetical protein
MSDVLDFTVNAVIFGLFFSVLFLLLYKLKVLKINFITILIFSGVLHIIVAFVLKNYVKF